MAWTETSPGLYQRPLGILETPSVSSSAASDGVTREPIRIHSFVDISVTKSTDRVIDAFRQAWTALRILKSPEVASTFDDGQKCYKVATLDELSTWHKRTFRIAEAGTPVTSIVQEMQQRLEPLPVLYIVPKGSKEEAFRGTIILFISHWMTEASGAFMMINQLCNYASGLLEEDSKIHTALSQHFPGKEASLLSPSLEDMFQPLKGTSEEEKVEPHPHNINLDQPVLEFPALDTANAETKPSHMMSNLRRYTSTSTSSLVKACKQKGLSVASAIHSAYLGAVWELASPQDRRRPYACIMPVQLRKRLPLSSIHRDQGCWNSARLIFLTAPADQGFQSLALSLRRQYAIAESKQWQHQDIQKVNEHTMIQFMKACSTSPAMPYITQIGLLDGDTIISGHGCISIENVSVWADSLGFGIVLGQWTFKEQLNLQISWNIAFHGREQVQSTMKAIERILRKELGVDLQMESVVTLTF